jgi:hypothetical protein
MSRIKLNDIAIDETANREALERVVGGMLACSPADMYMRKAGGDPTGVLLPGGSGFVNLFRKAGGDAGIAWGGPTFQGGSFQGGIAWGGPT